MRIAPQKLEAQIYLRLKVKKVNRVVCFSLSDWLKKCIHLNTEKRAHATIDIGKDL